MPANTPKAKAAASPPGGNVLTASSQNRLRTFLIARQDAPLPESVAPFDVDALLNSFADDPTVVVERVIQPQGLAVLAATPPLLQQIVVAAMSDDRAQALDQHPQVLIEEDALVRPVPVAPPPIAPPTTPPALVPSAVIPDLQDPGVFIPFGADTSWTVRVTGPDGTPVAGATVLLYGSGVPAQGRTAADGTVTLSLINDSDSTLQALYVNPEADYWELWLDRPALRSGQSTTVQLQPLSTTFGDFPATQVMGWGQLTMGLDSIDALTFTGAGAKVAIIDSGAAVTHPDLQQIKVGQDLTVTPVNDTGWTNDVIAHGSHCSGVIAGRNDGSGIRGFAPAADVRELRIFPGGRFSNILDALDYCISEQIDIVNMSLGSAATSQLLAEKISQAKAAGVACIVAAGNSGGDVQFPGSLPDVLTVAALGKLGQFPAATFHARQVPVNGPFVNGYFSPTFTCHGPEVDLCAPGVAVLSSVPSAGYAAWDGTSMAAPHITGLGALVLAHHPDFSGPFSTHDGARVDRLFTLLKNAATALDLGDPGRTGAGVPDAAAALRGAAATGVPTPATEDLNTELEQLRLAFVRAGLL